ncbi:Asp-tRNA(Asn)/Glu-tRNA(Gln) amidotransferase subunit GatC [Candidatus Woesebacteria bacterium]|nr:Asp-tRNA(Asn)/Glu-tRNA(Gln) amidotransferase subunit GatC [Candidatus Woesebacteria bacterium]
MGKLSSDDVKHVSQLAKLSLTDNEVKKFQKQLEKVIDYISELNEVDTKNIEPTSQTTGLTNISRDDKVISEDCLSQENTLSGTSKKHNSYFVVPGILEERSDK